MGQIREAMRRGSTFTGSESGARTEYTATAAKVEDLCATPQQEQIEDVGSEMRRCGTGPRFRVQGLKFEHSERDSLLQAQARSQTHTSALREVGNFSLRTSWRREGLELSTANDGPSSIHESKSAFLPNTYSPSRARERATTRRRTSRTACTRPRRLAY